MGAKVIVAAAVVGAEVTRAQSPYVPYTPAEIARAAVDAGRASKRIVREVSPIATSSASISRKSPAWVGARTSSAS